MGQYGAGPGLRLNAEESAALALIEERALWLASWTIHNANHLRESRDGLKVGGHQASCASMTTLMTALYFKALQPWDRVAVKPHASPVFHAIQHMFGRQTVQKLKDFRGLGGAQSYPSRTKDVDDVDFSTGSVGLGVAVTAFASLVQDFVVARDWIAPERRGRFIALLGDAELDEGNVYEALIECAKHDVRDTWWVVDYNRQSLDATTPERMFDRYDDIFATAGWSVDTLKFGRLQREAFRELGGGALRDWIEACPNALYAALTYEGGAAWRDRLSADLGDVRGIPALLAARSDEALDTLMTTLGGHCLDTVLDAYARAAADDRPKFILAYTIKGRRLPFQGHKDNHSGLMTPTQIAAFRTQLGVPEGQEWDVWAGLSPDQKNACLTLMANAPFADPVQRQLEAPAIATPGWDAFPKVADRTVSTQAAFGKIMHELSKAETPFADRIVTTSPDVTVSTNLGAFVNRRGIFSRARREDVFKTRKIASPQNWAQGESGQHIELGIAENNLFLLLAALGLSAPLFGQRLFPVGTLYDPFISRGLDALNYACYQDARFVLVATPSGLTLGPEGGAHQSINGPLIGISQPGLAAYEPAYADELAAILQHGFAQLHDADGESLYLRLSTRILEQPVRADEQWRAGTLAGAYWLRPPAPAADLAIAYSGALVPEALAAWEMVQEDAPGAGLLAVTSPDLLHRDFTARPDNLAARLLADLSPRAGLVTVTDGSPAALSWLGSAHGHRVRPLGVERFGQTGDLPDLYRTYKLDADAIVDAAAALYLT
ncbi:MAG: transketolase [Caulobacterales bacterium]